MKILIIVLFSVLTTACSSNPANDLAWEEFTSSRTILLVVPQDSVNTPVELEVQLEDSH